METPQSVVSPLIENHKMTELSRAYKIMRTTALCYIFVCLGAFSEITGPVLPELIVQTKSHYAIMAQAISMRGGGHALGGIIGGFTVDRWFHHIDILIAVAIMCYTSAAVGSAYVVKVPVMFVVYFIQGSTETWLLIAIRRISLQLWQGKSAVAQNALSFGYYTGSVIAPFIASLFLDPRFSGGFIETGHKSTCKVIGNQTLKAAHSADNSTISTIPTAHMPTPEYPANFVNAYWIITGLSLAAISIFVAFHVYGRVKGVQLTAKSDSFSGGGLSLRGYFSPSTCSPIHPTYTVLIIVMLFFYQFLVYPQMRLFTKFIFSYARDGPCLSVTESTGLLSAYFVSTLVCSLVFGILSALIHVKYLLQIAVLGTLGCALTLFFLHTNVTVLWVTCTALGFFCGANIPSTIAWANRYIEVTAAVQMITQIGAALGDLVIAYGMGYSYQHYGPYTLWSFQLGLAATICVVSWIMLILGALHGDRFQKDEE